MKQYSQKTTELVSVRLGVQADRGKLCPSLRGRYFGGRRESGSARTRQSAGWRARTGVSLVGRDLMGERNPCPYVGLSLSPNYLPLRGFVPAFLSDCTFRMQVGMRLRERLDVQNRGTCPQVGVYGM